MAKEVKAIMSRSADHLLGDIIGALGLVASFILLLHLPVLL